MSEHESTQSTNGKKTGKPILRLFPNINPKTVDDRELVRTDAGDFQAKNVTMDRSGAENITSERASLNHSGATNLTTRVAQLDRSGAVRINSEQAVLEESAVLALQTREARLVNSKALFVKSEATSVEGKLIALVHIGNAEGEVKPLLSPASAAAAAGGFAFALLLVSKLLRGIFGRK